MSDRCPVCRAPVVVEVQPQAGAPGTPGGYRYVPPAGRLDVERLTTKELDELTLWLVKDCSNAEELRAALRRLAAAQEETP